MENPPKGKAIQPNDEEQGFGVQEFRVIQEPNFRDSHIYRITVVSVPYPGETKSETYEIGRIFRDMDQFQDFGRWYDADEDDSHRITPKSPVGFTMDEAVHKMFDRFVNKSSNNPPRGEKHMPTIFEPFAIKTTHGVVQFTPMAENPEEKPYTLRTKLELKEPERYGPALGAQLFVGLNVGSKTVWDAKEIRDFVFQVRQVQLIQMIEAGLVAPGASHGGSVRPQYGFWGKVSDEHPGTEPSVSVLIDNISGEDDRDFIENMKLLAGEIALAFKQKTVYCQIHRAGVVQETFDVSTKART
jgi:hypothetical protein